MQLSQSRRERNWRTQTKLGVCNVVLSIYTVFYICSNYRLIWAENCCTTPSRFNMLITAYPEFAAGVGEGVSLHSGGGAVERVRRK